jgi:integrase
MDLGADKAAAFAKFAELVSGAAESLGLKITQQATNTGVRAGTVAELVPKYLSDIRHRLKPKGWTDIADRLAWLVRWFGVLAPSQLVPTDIERQAKAERWKRGTIRQTLAAVQSFVRWCGLERFRLRIPPPEYRGHECVVSAEEFAACESSSTGDYPALLRVLWETGARPGEVRTLTVEGVDWIRCVAVLREHKTAKTGRLRTILFSPTAMAALHRQREKYGSGALFRGSTGRTLSMSGVNARWRNLREMGLVRTGTVYALRHSCVTRMLESGVSETDVAALLGTSTTMIARTYSHVSANLTRLRGLVDRMAG